MFRTSMKLHMSWWSASVLCAVCRWGRHSAFGSGDLMADYFSSFGLGVGYGFGMYIVFSLLGYSIYKALGFFKL